LTLSSFQTVRGTRLDDLFIVGEGVTDKLPAIAIPSQHPVQYASAGREGGDELRGPISSYQCRTLKETKLNVDVHVPGKTRPPWGV
jgi:hypothetical protein